MDCTTFRDPAKCHLTTTTLSLSLDKGSDDMLGCGDSPVDRLVQWRDPRATGPIFASVLVFLVAVRYLSVLSVVGNLSLALLTATMAFRIYKSVLAAVNKSGEGNPFKVCVWGGGQERERHFSLSGLHFFLLVIANQYWYH